MKGLITDKTRVIHIIEAISEVEKYLNGVTYEKFLNNSEKRFATVNQLKLLVRLAML
jgi:uncharacterized protein with HEPN domain